MSQPRRILLTGASRGLGLEFTRIWLEQENQVFALTRQPEASPGLKELMELHQGKLLPVPCDVADDRSVQKAAATVQESCDRLDVVLNNAGVYGPRSGDLATLDFDDVRGVFEINTLGPIRISRAFLPLLRQGVQPRLAHITSLMGSVDDNTSGGAWAYRMSKTALNMASRNLAHELQSDGILSVVIHPGWVRTDMGGPGAPLSIQESVAAIAGTIDSLGLEQSGGFFDRDGNPLSW